MHRGSVGTRECQFSNLHTKLIQLWLSRIGRIIKIPCRVSDLSAISRSAMHFDRGLSDPVASFESCEIQALLSGDADPSSPSFQRPYRPRRRSEGGRESEERLDRPTSMSLKGNCALKPLCNVSPISKDPATRDSQRSTNTGTGLRRMPMKAWCVPLYLWRMPASRTSEPTF